MITNKRIAWLAEHWRLRYEREIDVTLKTRMVSGIEDIFYDTSEALKELLETRLEFTKVRPEPPDDEDPNGDMYHADRRALGISYTGVLPYGAHPLDRTDDIERSDDATSD